MSGQSSGTAPDILQIRIAQRAQLFNMLDPCPFGERDLDPAAEAYLVEWAEELPTGHPLRIVVRMPAEEADDFEAADLPDAIRNYFAGRAAAMTRELRELFRVGRISLVIGLCVLGLCLLLAQAISGRFGEARFVSFAEESLVIVGWVANWRPIEIFLYDWWPLVRQRRLFTRLAQAQVEVRAEADD
jgi:hypothetical protein